MILPRLAVLIWAAASVLLTWCYFRRFRISRPPVGVIGSGDVFVLLVGVVVVPYLYLVLPLPLVVALLGLAEVGMVSVATEPLVGRRVAWLVTVTLAAADIWAAGRSGFVTYLVNNVLLVVVVVAVSNTWAQSGMRARDAAVLGSSLAVYDLVATWLIGQTDDLIRRLAGLPFAPLVSWPVDASVGWLGIGLGDLLLSSLYPVVVLKAFGNLAGLTSLGLSLLILLILLLIPLPGTFPVMVLLGPSMLLQYSLWARRRGCERTTWEYLQAVRSPLNRRGLRVVIGGACGVSRAGTSTSPLTSETETPGGSI